MNDEEKKRYEHLREISREKNRLKKRKSNSLLMDCLNHIEKKEILSQEKEKDVVSNIIERYSINEAGHVSWEKCNCFHAVVQYEEVSNYIDVNDMYIIVWDNADLPVLKCRLQSFLDNMDDVEAVAFDYMIVSENYKILLESKEYGFVTLGMLDRGRHGDGSAVIF